MGFDVVEYKEVDINNIEDTVAQFHDKVLENDFGSDGLVLTYDSLSYSQSLGSTAKFPEILLLLNGQMK